jgi:hypothetical protein
MRLLRNDGCARRPRPDVRRIQLLVFESGAANLGPDISSADFDELIVLGQCQGESLSELLLRASARLSGLERAYSQVGRAVIAIAPLHEPQFAAARRLLGLAILSHVLVAAQASELVLAVDEHAAPELRSDVIALVESLVAHPGSRYAPIRVHLAPPASTMEPEGRESGIHPVLGHHAQAQRNADSVSMLRR